MVVYKKGGAFERELEAKRAELKRLQMQKLQMEIDKTAMEIASKEVECLHGGAG